MAADPSEVIDSEEDGEFGYRKFYDWLNRGVPMSTLSRIFRMEVDTARRKLAGVKPIGERNGYPTYSVAEAAEYLVSPKIDVEAYLKKLRPQDMPQGIQKQFWDAQNARLKFMADAKHLWRTDTIQYALSDIFKTVRQRVLLFSDTVERQTGLTEEQRNLVQGMADGLLDDLRESIIKSAQNLPAEANRDEMFESGPPKATFGPDIDDEEAWGGL